MSEPARAPYGPYTDEILELAEQVRAKALRNLRRPAADPAPPKDADGARDRPTRVRTHPTRDGA